MVHSKMNPEAKTLWIAALESNEYVQGRNTLCYRSNDGLAFSVLNDDMGLTFQQIADIIKEEF